MEASHHFLADKGGMRRKLVGKHLHPPFPSSTTCFPMPGQDVESTVSIDQPETRREGHSQTLILALWEGSQQNSLSFSTLSINHIPLGIQADC